jgi:streptogramin lyase
MTASDGMASDGMSSDAMSPPLIGENPSEAPCGTLALMPRGFIEIAEPSYFPDSISTDSGAQLYIGSAATGAIMRAPSVGGAPEVVVAPSAAGTLGLAVDAVAGRLWRCRTDLTLASPSAIEVLDWESGASLAVHELPAQAFCNGLALDRDRNAYATDSLGQRIFRVRADGALTSDAPEVWSSDPAFDVPPGEFGLNGISFDGSAAVYVSDMYNASIYRIAIAPDGTAGPAESIDTQGALVSPDGILWHDGSLLVTDFATGKLFQVTPSSAPVTVSSILDGLAAPTSLVVSSDTLWVVESQADHLFDPTLGPPTSPFRVTGLSLCLPSVQ